MPASPAALLTRQIEDFTASMLGEADVSRFPDHGKAIHDAVWGTHIFHPWEIALVDTPLMQRLRGIKQTSFAYLTYPAANHTRFEHSLGVVVTADRLLDALTANQPPNLKPRPDDRIRVRLAALLHDCGHLFLSHIGEAQLVGDPQIAGVRKSAAKLAKPKTHELLSYMIVSSKAFRSYFKLLQRRYRDQSYELGDVDIGEVANYIIGEAHYRRKHFADMINGPFDADKLDYLTRDAYFTGLRISLDIDRLLYSMTIRVVDQEWMRKRSSETAPEGEPKKKVSLKCPRRLVVRASGVSALEQILFAKMQLVATVYHHHKIRAADTMLTSYVEYLRENAPGGGSAVPLQSPIEYLQWTDADWLVGNHPDEYLSSVAKRLRNRDLPKRALVISSRTADSGLENFTRLKRHPKRVAILAELRRDVMEELTLKAPGHGLEEHDLIIDMPEEPSLREARQTAILTPDESLAILDEYFPSGGWLETYVSNKWRAHVFCRDGANGLRLKVAKAARDVFGRDDGLHLKLSDEAFIQAHLAPADVESSY